MTSPARCRRTVSPSRTSLRASSSSLCSVALVTTTPADGDGIEPRHRRQRTGAADLDLDLPQHRRRLLGRKLVGDRPARGARDKAEALLQRDAVDLVDHAVDIVGQRRPLGLDAVVLREQRLRGVGQNHQRVDRQAIPGEGLDHAGLGVGRRSRGLAPGVGEEVQRARRGHRRVDLAKRAGGRVAGIGVKRSAGLRLPRVDAGEPVLGHVDLAAHVEDARRLAFQGVRNAADRAHVGGDVLALLSVAARRRLNQHAVLVAQRTGEPVDLRLGGDRELVLRLQSEKAPHPGAEVRDLRVGEDVAEREHARSCGGPWRTFSDGGAPIVLLGDEPMRNSGCAASIASRRRRSVS